MHLLTFIITGLIYGILQILPLPTISQISLLNNTFNTQIFLNTNFYISIKISTIIIIIILLRKDIIKFLKTLKKSFTNKKKNLKQPKLKKLFIPFLITIIPSTIYLLIFNNKIKLYSSSFKIAIFFFLSALLILYINKAKEENKYINIKQAFIISIILLLCSIFNISLILSLFFSYSLFKINKNNCLKYILLSLLFFYTITLITNYNILNYLQENNFMILNFTVGIFSSTISSLYTSKYLSKLFIKKKLWLISLYCLFSAIFTLIWFR